MGCRLNADKGSSPRARFSSVLDAVRNAVGSFPQSLWAVAAVAFALLSCDDAERGDGPTGDMPPAAVPEFALDTIQVIEDEVIWRVSRVRLGEDGRVFAVVAPGEVLVFGADGTLEHSIGGRGQGPGEFATTPRDLMIAGDSVYVLDSLIRRVSLFVGSEFEESWSFRELPGNAERLQPRDDGTITLALMEGSSVQGSPPGPHFYRRPVRVFEAEGSGLDTWTKLFEFPGVESKVQFLEGGMTRHSSPAFRTTTHYDLTEAGLIAADQRSGRVWTRAWNGTEHTLLDPPEPVYVSSEELALWETRLRDQLARLRELGQDAELAEISAYESLDRWEGQIPRPVYSALVTDGRRIALETYDMRDDVPRDWVVLDLDGSTVGTWTLPANVTLRAMRWPVLAAVATDAMDVETILLLRVRD